MEEDLRLKLIVLYIDLHTIFYLLACDNLDQSHEYQRFSEKIELDHKSQSHTHPTICSNLK